MQVAGVVMVKDDIPMLIDNIEYHRSIGVDYFLICDRGSNTDSIAQLNQFVAGTKNIILMRQNLYEITDKSSIDMNIERIRPFNAAVREFNADYLYVSDTDEFWVPSTGNIKEDLQLEDEDHLIVPRFNAAMGFDSSQGVFDRLRKNHSLFDQRVIVDRVNLSRKAMNDDPDTPWILHDINSKFITSAKKVTKIYPGFHDLDSNDNDTKRLSHKLAICHFPFTSLERFKFKIDGMRIHLKHIDLVPGKGHGGWHWRRWIEELNSDEDVAAEFEKQFFTTSQLTKMSNSGIVETFREYFDSIN